MDDKNNDGKKKPAGSWAELNKSFGMLFNIGYYISASVMIGLFIGYQADKFFGTQPLFTLVMTFLGMGAGLLEIFKASKIK